MNVDFRVVMHLPVVELWRLDGFITKQRGLFLAAEDVIALLLQGRTHFVVANIGDPLKWIAPADCFTFWRREVQSHLVAPEANILLSSLPDGFGYFASRWEGADLPIILIETHH